MHISLILGLKAQCQYDIGLAIPISSYDLYCKKIQLVEIECNVSYLFSGTFCLDVFPAPLVPELCRVL